MNIGSQEMVTTNNFASMIADIAGKEQAIDHIPEPLGVRGRNSDNNRIAEKLGWKPIEGLESGLRKAYPRIEQQVVQLWGRNVAA